jgi:hypothetical protein
MHESSFFEFLDIYALTYLIYHRLTIFLLRTANATRQTQVLGLLGLRRGLISKWLGHPHSALSGAVYISL